jgi:hypothetical protein
MIVIVDRIRKNGLEVFPKIDDFISFLKSDYSNINFEDDKIKSSILSIYNKLINEEGSIPYKRLTRWLRTEFNFNFWNKYSLDFWIERGYTEEYYKNYSNKVFEGLLENLKKFRKDKKITSFEYDPNYSNEYKYKNTIFTSDKRPICNICNSNIDLRKSTRLESPIYVVEKCSNNDCIANNTKKLEIKWQAFLPKESYDIIKNNKKSVKRTFSKEFWIKKGYTEEDAIKKVSEIQSANSKKFTGSRITNTKEYWRKKGLNEDEIKEKYSTNMNINFWIKKGFSEEEAKIKVFNHQSNAAKHIDYKNREVKGRTNYWTKRGFTEEEAKLKVIECQTTFSKEICIKKWGEEKGLEVFNERTNKWLNSLKENDNIFVGYSKISQELFDILDGLINDNEFQYAKKGGEFKIKRENGGYYFYDFTDNKNKKIIEYNGDMYHGNPSFYLESDFPHPFRKEIEAKEIWEKDALKIKCANDNGYEVLIIWDSEYRSKGIENKDALIKKCLNFLTNN